MKRSLRTELPQIVVVVLLFVASALAWPRVPERLPVHWNLAGEVDRWGGRAEGLLVMPGAALLVYLLLLLVPRIDPGRENYASFARPYLVIRWLVLAIFAGSHAVMLANALGEDPGSSLPGLHWLPVLVGALLVVLGNLMGKLRPNWFVGIRTPWTLSSKRSWTRTHRLGGWLFVLFGLLVIVGGLVRHPWLWTGIAAAGGIALVGLAVYSYLVWRDDEDRVPPSGTLPEHAAQGRADDGGRRSPTESRPSR